MAQTQPVVGHPSVLDLTADPPFHELVPAFERMRIHSSFLKGVAAVASEPSFTERVVRLNQTLRELDTPEAVYFTLAVARLALRSDPSGLRVLSSLLNVKRPGVEVLKRLQSLSSLERVSLQIISGRWREPSETEGENPVYSIMEMFGEATRIGVLDLGLERLPKRSIAICSVVAHLRHWFAWVSLKLSAGQKLPESDLNFLVQLCMIEIILTERRVSRIAESIDPYDMVGMARLMPILSRYDQDVDHMKTVVSQLTTYRPFHERELSVEVAITENEIRKLQKALLKHPAGGVMARIIEQMRANPILEREYLFLVSVVHQIATLRALNLEEAPSPDVLSTVSLVLDYYRENQPIPIRIEPEIVQTIWPILRTWGILDLAEEGLLLHYREERSLDFIEVDGTPKLPERPKALEKTSLSIEEMVRSQMHNEMFLLGILGNPRALSKPRVIPLIALHSRSSRVLQRIAGTRSLHTGPANKDVPRLILMNPTRTPLATLRRFINVRFVSKTDLQRMASAHSDIRPEVRSEIAAYLKSLK